MEETRQNIILVVDDEDAHRDLCREALQISGYKVMTAADGREAIAILAAHDVDAIVCDIQMPHNGHRVYEYIQEQRPDLRDRFIFVTGNPEKKAEVEGSTSAAAFLMKPFSIKTLLETMRSVLDGA